MRTIITPKVDMLLVSKSSMTQRKSIMNFAPKIGLTVVDYSRLEGIDNFYTECQNFRDYYRDPYNKLPRPPSFKKHYGKCGSRVGDRNTELLTLPVNCVRETQPATFPMQFDNGMHLGEGWKLTGQYDPFTCVKFKR